jgi:hypothetical protein
MPIPFDQVRIARAVRAILRTIYVENQEAFGAEAAARRIPLEALAAAITGMLQQELQAAAWRRRLARGCSPFKRAAARLLARAKLRGAGS